MRPAHWWLAVPAIGAPRRELEWLVYPVCAGAAMLALLLWTRAGAPIEGTARATAPAVAQETLANARGSDGGGSVAMSGGSAPAGAPSLTLPRGERSAFRAADRASGTALLSVLDVLDAVTGERRIDGGLLVNEAGAMGGGFSIGFGTTVRWKPPVGTSYSIAGPSFYATCGRPVQSCTRSMREHQAAGPTVTIGRISEEAEDVPDVRRYLRRYREKITYCYEKRLMAQPRLEGTVATRFTIARDGRVEDVSVSGVDDEVDACIAGVLGGVAFPARRVPAIVAYPFELRLR